jgi:hypothetical protein
MGQIAQILILVLWYCISFSAFVLENLRTKLERQIDHILILIASQWINAIWKRWE